MKIKIQGLSQGLDNNRRKGQKMVKRKITKI